MKHCAALKLIVVHYHLRPGGVRRVIELASPHIARRMGFAPVVLATGEAPDDAWLLGFQRMIAPTPVEVVTLPALRYFSEQRGSVAVLQRKLRVGLGKLLAGDCLVWAHNPGLGRNLLLTRELVRVCEARRIRLVMHQHDWWFENRWQRWPEMRRCGFRTLRAVAEAVFPAAPNIVHATINRADAEILSRHFPARVRWLPNPVERTNPPPAARVRVARRLLRESLGSDAPVWLLPCRLLRRKNAAEALLLTRWLRPGAWLVTTGGVSSADEVEYEAKLADAARENGWPLRLGLLAWNGFEKASLPEIMAASEAVLLTSIQEGFGLPALEAAAAGRPLIARRLPNVAPDLAAMGFRFPQSYEDIYVAPELFDWAEEVRRQGALFRAWLGKLPRTFRKAAAQPQMLSSPASQRAVPLSRLTLTAQLEVLAKPASESWRLCAPLNPFLKTWKTRAAAGCLSVTPWPQGAAKWLNGPGYGAQFSETVRAEPCCHGETSSSRATQEEFIRARLDAQHLFPLLWSRST